MSTEDDTQPAAPDGTAPTEPPEPPGNTSSSEPPASADASSSDPPPSPAVPSSGESPPWQPSPTAAADALGREARKVLEGAAERALGPTGAEGRVARARAPAPPVPSAPGELTQDVIKAAGAEAQAQLAQKGPPPAPPSELVGGAAVRTVGETPAGGARSPSELVRGALSHMAHDTPGGPRATAAARHEPAPVGTTHTAGETPSAYDARAMGARMGTRKPAGAVTLGELARRAAERSLERAAGAKPSQRAASSARPTSPRAALHSRLPDFVRNPKK